MKPTRKSLTVIILLITPLLLSSVITSPVYEVGTSLIQNPSKICTPSYDSHNPIVILNDTHFDEIAGLESWDGDGSLGTPYIIDGYNITSDETCIKIRDTTLAFEIRNCYLSSISGYDGTGIEINNVTQASIFDTFVLNKYKSIDIMNTPVPYIENCTIHDSYLIYLGNCTGATITECDIYENTNDGIYLYECNNSLISNNEIYDNGGQGLLVESSYFLTITTNTIARNGDEGMYLDQCTNATIRDNDIWENDNGGEGVYLEAGSFNLIEANRIWNNSNTGISSYDEDNIQISENQIYNNSMLGIFTYDSHYSRITGNDIWGNGWDSNPYASGIYVDSCNDSLIETNQIWNNTFTGIYIDDSVLVEISSNRIFNNTYQGIYGYFSNDIFVSNNNISGNSWNSTESYRGGITTEASCQRWNITENRISDNRHHGMFIYGYRMYISQNQVYNHSESGISTWMAINYTVADNIVYSNNVGIFLGNNIEANITGNILYDNELGINLYGVDEVVLHHNDFAWNTKNAEETWIFNNSWNNTALIGNWWSDFNGTGSYGITNTTGDVVNYDNYPRKSLDLNASVSLGYELGDTGNVMVWPAQALNPSHYEVFVGIDMISSDSWDGADITINLDGFEVGSFEIRLVAYHISGHWTNATSSLTVIDTTGPIWVIAPTSQEIEFGEMFSYQISASDLSGISSYSVNDTVNFHISETGLITNTTSLEIGTYGLEITVADFNMNELTISITITVVAATDTNTTTTSTGPGPSGDSTLLLILGVGVTVGIIFVVLIVFIKKRR